MTDRLQEQGKLPVGAFCVPDQGEDLKDDQQSQDNGADDILVPIDDGEEQQYGENDQQQPAGDVQAKVLKAHIFRFVDKGMPL